MSQRIIVVNTIREEKNEEEADVVIIFIDQEI